MHKVTYYYGDIYGEFSNAVANFWYYGMGHF